MPASSTLYGGPQLPTATPAQSSRSGDVRLLRFARSPQATGGRRVTLDSDPLLPGKIYALGGVEYNVRCLLFRIGNHRTDRH